MTSDEIREQKIVFLGDSHDTALLKIGTAQFNMIKEIAAQLSDINQNLYRVTHPDESKLMDAIYAAGQVPLKGQGL